MCYYELSVSKISSVTMYVQSNFNEIYVTQSNYPLNNINLAINKKLIN